MLAPETTLDDLRREIDEIDTAMQDLIIRRAEVVDRIAAVKAGSNSHALHPGREAVVLRRLVERHRGRFPKPALVRVWREIMSTFLHLQQSLVVAVYAPEAGPGYWDLARDHFGCATPITACRTAGQVLRAVADGRAMVGILPLPQDDDVEPWWIHLLAEDSRTPRIVARLPFGARGNARPEGGDALVVGCFAQEATGRDASFLALETVAEVSRGRLKAALSEAGLDPTGFVGWQNRSAPELWFHLVEIGDFVAPDDPRIERLLGGRDGLVRRLVPLGGYALPLSETELGTP